MLKNDHNPHNPILIVDDETYALKSFELTLRSGGLNNIISCSDSRRVYDLIEREEIELVLLDLLMPDLPGDEILSRMSESRPEIPVIMVTGVNEVDTAVICMQKGAFDYVLKPANRDRLLPAVYRAIEVRQLRRENSALAQCFFQDTLKHPERFSRIITKSSKMRSIFQYCEAVARGRHPILITGETGVGKELVAEAIHEISGRSGDFVGINVAGLDDNYFSDTLFGHVRGAFTDALTVRSGLIEKATGGTLFLDEIGDLSLASQVKLLRLLDKNEYFPLGSDVSKPANVRFIFATNKDLSAAVSEGRFRQDFYYRMRTHHLHVPALRDRADDIPILLDHFIFAAAKEFNKIAPSYPLELVSFLQNYAFPGNIRELKSLVFDAVGRCHSEILSSDCFQIEMQPRKNISAYPFHPLGPSIKHWLAQLEKFPSIKETTAALIDEALSQANNNQRIAALMLGITPQALNQRLRKDRRNSG